MNKKALIAFNMLKFIVNIFFLVAVLFSVVLLVRSYVAIDINVFDIETDLFIRRLFYSQAITYYDSEAARLYPGTIDINKIMSENVENLLNNEIYYGEKNEHIAARITLKDLNGLEIKSVYYNKEKYDDWAKKYRAGLTRGPGGITGKVKREYITVYDKKSFEIARLEKEKEFAAYDRFYDFANTLNKQINELKAKQEETQKHMTSAILEVEVLIPNS